MAYSFRKMFFIGPSLNHVSMTYSFLELLIFFWLTQIDINCLEFISHHITEILYLNTNSKGNQSWNKNNHFHLFLSWNKNKHFHLFPEYKVKNSSWTIFIFSQFHERIFRRSRSQMFFKIGALKVSQHSGLKGDSNELLFCEFTSFLTTPPVAASVFFQST